jgi:hypothetical protein
MRYILMDYVNESGWPALTRAEQEHWLGAYRAYMVAMTKAGVLKSNSGLQPTASATTVRQLGPRPRFTVSRCAQPWGTLLTRDMSEFIKPA